jgi:hypothetical protein
MKGWTRVKDPLKWLSVACAIAVTATAEYDLAVAVGMHEAVAVAVPGALDAYVVRALQRNREVLTSVLAMVGVNAASHLEAAGILALDWRLITAVSAIAPLVLWRVHSLKDPGTWRARKTHGVPTASTEEHERAPEENEQPDTREHPEHPDDLDVPEFMKEPLADMRRVLDEGWTPVTDAGTPEYDDRLCSCQHWPDKHNEHGVSTTVRAMKSALGAGTPRAQRLLAAVRIELTEGAHS